MNAYCAHCGSQLPPEAAFCGTCGTPVAGRAPQSPESLLQEPGPQTQQPTPIETSSEPHVGDPRPKPNKSTNPRVLASPAATGAGRSRAVKRALMFGVPAAIAVIAVLAVFAVRVSAPQLATVKVVLSVYNEGPGAPTGDCDSGLFGHGEPRAGTVVSITGDAGQVLGTGTVSTSEASTQACTYEAEIPGVPEDQSLYSLSVGGQHNLGSVTKAQLSRQGWTFAQAWS